MVASTKRFLEPVAKLDHRVPERDGHLIDDHVVSSLVHETLGPLAPVAGVLALAPMGTSLDMIDRTYGHRAPDAEAAELALLDSYDFGRGTRSAVR